VYQEKQRREGRLTGPRGSLLKTSIYYPSKKGKWISFYRHFLVEFQENEKNLFGWPACLWFI